jgi:hypothetical protein
MRKYLYFFIYYNLIQNILEELQSLKLNSENNINKIKNCMLLGEIYKSIDTDVITSYNDLNKNVYQIFFEIESGYFIRTQQQTFIDKVITENNPQFINSAYQLLMGRGKTNAITPLLLLYYYFDKQNKNFMIVLPQSLVKSSQDIMLRFIKYFNNMYIQTYIDMDEKIIDHKYVLKSQNQIKICSDVFVKINLLEYFINKRGAKNLSNIDTSDVIFIFDEIDSMIDPLKSNLNIVTGETVKVPYRNFINSIVLSIINELITNNLNTNFDEVFNVIKGRINNEESTRNIPETFILSVKNKLKIAKDFCIKDSQILFNTREGFGFGDYSYGKKIKNIRLTENSNFFTCIPYLNNNEPMNGSKFTDIELIIFSTTLGYYYQWIVKKNIRKEDLLIIIKEYNEINDKFLYKIDIAKNTFTKFFEIFKDDLDLLLTFDSLNNLLDDYCEKFNLIENNLIKYEFLYEFMESIIYKYFILINNEHNNISFIDVLGLCQNKILFSGTTDFLNPKDTMIQLFNPQNNASHGTGANVSPGAGADANASPRNDNNNLLFKNNNIIYRKNGKEIRLKGVIDSVCNRIDNDRYSEGSIKSAILGLTTIMPKLFVQINQLPSNNPIITSTEFNFLNFVFSGELLNEYQALVDVGGFIIDTPVIEMVKILHRKFNKKRNILYVDKTGQRLIYTKNEEILKYNGELFKTNEVFMYYDNQHIVGIDFKQPLTMKALVTIDNNNTITQVAQGIFRLRKLNVTHTFDIYLKNNFIGKKNGNGNRSLLVVYENDEDKLTKLYKILKNNGTIMKSNTIFYMKSQLLKYIIRYLNKFESRFYIESFSIQNNMNKNIENVIIQNYEKIFETIFGKKPFINKTELSLSLSPMIQTTLQTEHEHLNELEREMQRQKEMQREKLFEKSLLYINKSIVYNLSNNYITNTFANFLNNNLFNGVRPNNMQKINILGVEINILNSVLNNLSCGISFSNSSRVSKKRNNIEKKRIEEERRKKFEEEQKRRESRPSAGRGYPEYNPYGGKKYFKKQKGGALTEDQIVMLDTRNYQENPMSYVRINQDGQETDRKPITSIKRGKGFNKNMIQINNETGMSTASFYTISDDGTTLIYDQGYRKGVVKSVTPMSPMTPISPMSIPISTYGTARAAPLPQGNEFNNQSLNYNTLKKRNDNYSGFRISTDYKSYSFMYLEELNFARIKPYQLFLVKYLDTNKLVVIDYFTFINFMTRVHFLISKENKKNANNNSFRFYEDIKTYYDSIPYPELMTKLQNIEIYNYNIELVYSFELTFRMKNIPNNNPDKYRLTNQLKEQLILYDNFHNPYIKFLRVLYLVLYQYKFSLPIIYRTLRSIERKYFNGLIESFSYMATMFHNKNIEFDYLVFYKINYKLKDRATRGVTANSPLKISDENKFIRNLFYLDIIKNPEIISRFIEYIKTNNKSLLEFEV